MASGRDPVLMIGGSLAALAAGVWLFSLADSGDRPKRTKRGDKTTSGKVSERQDEDDSRAQDEREEERADSSSRRKRTTKKKSKKKSVTAWVPSSARDSEARETSMATASRMS